MADYARCVRDPAVVHAMCEDYRAGATCDRRDDDEDRAAGRRIASPLQVLWAGRGALASWYDTLAVWREWADDVTGEALDCGHFIAEEEPGGTSAAIRRFHGAGCAGRPLHAVTASPGAGRAGPVPDGTQRGDPR